MAHICKMFSILIQTIKNLRQFIQNQLESLSLNILKSQISNSSQSSIRGCSLRGQWQERCQVSEASEESSDIPGGRHLSGAIGEPQVLSCAAWKGRARLPLQAWLQWPREDAFLGGVGDDALGVSCRLCSHFLRAHPLTMLYNGKLPFS